MENYFHNWENVSIELFYWHSTLNAFAEKVSTKESICNKSFIYILLRLKNTRTENKATH